MMNSNRNLGVFLGAATAVMAFGVTPYASAGDETFKLDIGGYRFGASNDISVGGPGTTGTEYRAEREGTPENDTVLRLEGSYRFFDRHRIRLMYLQSDREGSALSDHDITFRDTTVPLGTRVETGVKLKQAELNYLYSFWKNDDTEVAFLFGIHATKVETFLNAPSLNITKSAAVTGPLPMIGLSATKRLADKWELQGDVYGMKAKVNDVDGNSIAYRFAARYFFTPTFGAGVAWSGIRTRVNLTKSDWEGNLRTGNSGGELFLTVRF
jgi:hypothetical protein